MANQILSDYAGALTEILLPYIRDNFPKQTILLDQLKKNAGVEIINDEFIAPIRTSRHGGVANLANDGNNIISSGGPNVGRGTVAVKMVTGAFNISDLTIKATKSNKTAVENALTFQSTTLANDFSRQVNRQLYSDGIGVVSQVLGSVSATVASLQQPNSSLDDARSIDWYGTINGDISPTKYLAVNQILGIGTAGASGDGTVVAVDGTSVTLSDTAAQAANDSVYILDGSTAGAGSSEFVGVRAALSSTTGTSTYAGLARSTVGWTPQFGSASEALTMSRLSNSYLKAREYGATDDKYIILLNVSLYEKYGNILTAMRRTVNESDLLGGWTGLEFAAGAGRVGVFLDYDVPDGEALIIDLDSWTICQVGDLDWLEDPKGGGLLRLQSTTLYQAAMVWYANVMCLAPAANGRQTRKTN